MLSDYAFGMLTSVRQSYTPWQGQVALTLLIAALSGASCSDTVSGGELVADAALRLCRRLSDPNFPVRVLDMSADVRNGYLRLVAGDCRLDGLFPVRSATLAAWSNHLYDWNLDLWGCTDRVATGFALVHAEVGDLTSADAALLIDDYLTTAASTLRLSPSEATRIRQDLVRLGMAAITR